MYDVTVIGGGPAGTAAAISAARRGKRVLLLERGRYPRHKVCGEFVSAESLGILLDLLSHDESVSSRWEPPASVSRFRIFVDGSVLDGAIDPPAASISRLDLDSALWTAAVHAGVDARQQQAVVEIGRPSPFVISTANEKFESRTVINASGRWSNLSISRTPAAKSNGRTWLGVKAHFLEPRIADSVDLYFFEGGYCGVQPLSCSSESRINACAMVRSDVANSLPEVFGCSPALRNRSRDWRQITDIVSTAPLIFRTPEPERDGILLAGDAAGFVDPFVGDGISLALRSGVMAAQALSGHLDNGETLDFACQQYRREYRRKLAPVFRTSSKIRHLFSLPTIVRVPLARFFERAPSLTHYLIRKTR